MIGKAWLLKRRQRENEVEIDHRPVSLVGGCAEDSGETRRLPGECESTTADQGPGT